MRKKARKLGLPTLIKKLTPGRGKRGMKKMEKLFVVKSKY